MAAITTESGGIVQASGTLSAANASLVAGVGGASGDTGIALGGAIVVAGTLQLDTSGPIAQTGGSITAATLTDLPRLAAGTGPVTLTASGNHVATLGSFTSNGFALQDSQTLTVAGPVDAGPGALALTVVGGGLNLAGVLTAGMTALAAQGTVVQSAGSVASAAGPTTLSAGGDLTQLAGATIAGAGGPVALAANGGTLTNAGTIGNADAGARVTLSARDGIILGGTLNVPGGTLALLTPGVIAQPSGVMTAATLSGAGDDVTPTQAASVALGQPGNSVGTLGVFASAGNFSLTDSRGLVQAGPDLAGGALSLAVTGDLTLAGTLTGGGVSVTATGAIGQPSGGVTANAGALALLAGGNIGLSGQVTDLGGMVRLVAGGVITQPSGALVAAGLTGSAATATLAQPANRVGVLGAFTTAGDMTLVDGATLAIAGPVLAGAVAISAGGDVLQQGGGSIVGGTVDLTAAGQIALGGTLAGASIVLTAGGPIDATGTITAATLSGSGQSDVRLGNGANSIGDVAGLSAGGVLVLADGRSLTLGGPLAAGGPIMVGVTGDLMAPGTISGASVAMTATGALTQSGGISGANIALSGGAASGLILDGSLATPGTLLLLTSGAVAQPGGSIAAGLLTTGPTTPSSVTLAQPANRIAALGQLATVGDLTLVDGGSLLVLQPVASGGDVALDVAGDLVLASALSARTVALTASAIGQSGGIAADDIALQASGFIVLNGTVASAGTLRLRTPGVVAQTGGAVLAKLLTTDIPAASIAMLQGGNQIQALGPITVAGKLAIVDGRSLAVTGPINAGSVALTANAGAGTDGSLSVARDLNAGSLATLTAAGDVNQAAGTIAAAEIVATAGGSTSIKGSIVSPSLLSISGVGVSLSGEIVTAGVPSPKLRYGERLPVAAPGGLGATFVIDGGSAAPFSQTTAPGGVSVRPIAGTAFATLRIDLYGAGGVSPGSGTVRFGNLVAPRTNLVLDLGAGFATGPIDVNSLLVLGNGGGTSLSGIVNNFGGSQAAGVSIIAPISATNYRINSCVIASVNCVLIPQETAPVSTPSHDLTIATPRQDEDDPDLVVPNVSDRDY